MKEGAGGWVQDQKSLSKNVTVLRQIKKQNGKLINKTFNKISNLESSMFKNSVKKSKSNTNLFILLEHTTAYLISELILICYLL